MGGYYIMFSELIEVPKELVGEMRNYTKTRRSWQPLKELHMHQQCELVREIQVMSENFRKIIEFHLILLLYLVYNQMKKTEFCLKYMEKEGGVFPKKVLMAIASSIRNGSVNAGGFVKQQCDLMDGWRTKVTIKNLTDLKIEKEKAVEGALKYGSDLGKYYCKGAAYNPDLYPTCATIEEFLTFKDSQCSVEKFTMTCQTAKDKALGRAQVGQDYFAQAEWMKYEETAIKLSDLEAQLKQRKEEKEKDRIANLKNQADIKPPKRKYQKKADLQREQNNRKRS